MRAAATAGRSPDRTRAAPRLFGRRRRAV